MNPAPLPPLPEYDERRRMAIRLRVAWPWLVVLTLAAAPALHLLGLTGLPLVLGAALAGLLITFAVVLQARALPRRQQVSSQAPGDPALSQSPAQAA